MKHLNLTLLALLISLASFGQIGVILGASSVCVGATITLGDTTVPGTWTITPTTEATISSGGVVTGVSLGVAVVTYTVGGGSYVTHAVTVTAAPAPITGPATVCGGSSVTESDGVSGGIWSSSAPAVASLGSASGILTGYSVGTTTISYSLGTGCVVTRTVTVGVSPSIYTVTGGGNYCAGGAGVDITLSGSDAGITYQLFTGITAVGSALVGTGSMLDFGAQTAAGVYTVVASSSCSATMAGSATISIDPLPAAFTVTGGGSYCAGGAGVPVGLDASSTGMSYQLYHSGAPMGAPVLGTGAPISFGNQTSAGIYTVVATNTTTTCVSNMSGAATVTVVATVVPAVSISLPGTDTVCAGSMTTFTALPVNGGTSPTYEWYVDGVAAATGATYIYVPTTGDVVAVTVTSDAVCATPTTASSSVTMTVLPSLTPSVIITPTPGTAVCTGATASYTTAVTGGGTTPGYQWTLDGVDIAGAVASTYSYIPSSGDVVGVTVTSSYVCRTLSTASTSVTMTIDVPTVTATASTACGGTVTLTGAGATTYSWSPSTGLSCTGCSAPTLTPSSSTTYTVTGTDGTGCTGSGTVAVDGNSIAGHISYSGVPSAGDFTIWLVQFNPADSVISATDSMTNCVDGTGTAYYQFMDEPTGSYMVKAKLNASVPGTSGYIPTYSLSTPHWDSAATVAHAGGADNLDVNMIYGTVPAGPGFIAGYVISGAGRGTSPDVPAPGMTIYLKNASNNTLTYTTTASDGTYSFTGLGDGTYYIYPEAYKYYTTPSATIVLAPGSDSTGNIDFKQHTSTGLITPIADTKVKPLAATTGFSFYPNPAANSVEMNWANQATGTVSVTLTDVLGREVLATPLQMTTASGNTQLNLSGIVPGIYQLTVKSDNVYYSAKLVRE